jgi:thioredoxin reductase (NADPH)
MEGREPTFPTLTQAQIERIASIGERVTVRAGEVLFEPGQQNTRFTVVLAGKLEIVQPVDGRDVPTVVHEPGSFTGEINMLSARRSLVPSTRGNPEKWRNSESQ